MSERIELNEAQMDDVVGGNFNWWLEGDVRKCWVNDVGVFVCTPTAKDKFAWLKAEHKGEGWTEQMYADELVRLGEFTPI